MSAEQRPVIRVAVVDDEELVRDGLVAIVSSCPDFRVVGSAADGEQALRLVADAQPDVVLMDVRMPGTDGLEATRRIRSSGVATRVLILTTVVLDEVVYEALQAGASGFLLKSAPRSQLYAGLRAVAAGDSLLSPSITRRLIEAYVGLSPERRLDGGSSLELTARQAEVVRLVARGLSNNEIADELHLAPTTVKGYISEVLTRHQLRDRTQLVVLAYESGLVRAGG